MRELFLKVYEIRHRYHDAKDRMVWLASTAYLAFVFASIKWISENTTIWNTEDSRWVVYVIASIVFVTGGLFTLVENWYKAQTVVITNALTKQLKDFEGNKEPKSEDLLKALGSVDKKCFLQRVVIFSHDGLPGLVALLFMAVLFAFQIVTVSKLSHT